MWQPQLTRRLRVLLHVDPILSLRSWDDRRDKDSTTRHYDSVTLAMRVLDCIIEFTGLGEDVGSEAVRQALEPLLYQMDIAEGIEPDMQRHQQFANDLLGRLRNDEDARRPFEQKYIDFDGPTAVRRQLEFRLIEEHFASDDRIVLQLSPEAANLFLNALDLNIEDAQTALEAVIQSQLDRGRFDEAVASAQDAKSRSMQLESKIGRTLRDTQRDMTRVDWREDVPTLLHESLQHISRRLKVERDIADSARERLEHLELGSPEAAQVARIFQLMDDCYARHTQLYRTLLSARTVFFTEQDRQAFMLRPSAHLPNLFADVLEPLLAASDKVALQLLEGTDTSADPMMSILLGSRAPGVFSLEGLIADALRPRRETTQMSVPIKEQTWSESNPDVFRYTPEVRQRAESYLRNAPLQLSTILEAAMASGEPRAVLEYIS